MRGGNGTTGHGGIAHGTGDGMTRKAHHVRTQTFGGIGPSDLAALRDLGAAGTLYGFTYVWCERGAHMHTQAGTGASTPIPRKRSNGHAGALCTCKRARVSHNIRRVRIDPRTLDAYLAGRNAA